MQFLVGKVCKGKLKTVTETRVYSKQHLAHPNSSTLEILIHGKLTKCMSEYFALNDRVVEVYILSRALDPHWIFIHDSANHSAVC